MTQRKRKDVFGLLRGGYDCEHKKKEDAGDKRTVEPPRRPRKPAEEKKKKKSIVEGRGREQEVKEKEYS